jgi:hypothetical protein
LFAVLATEQVAFTSKFPLYIIKCVLDTCSFAETEQTANVEDATLTFDFRAQTVFNN